MTKIAILSKRKDFFLSFINKVDKNDIEVNFYKDLDKLLNFSNFYDFIIFDSSSFSENYFYDLLKTNKKEKLIYLSQYFDYEEFKYFLDNDINIFFKPLREHIFH